MKWFGVLVFTKFAQPYKFKTRRKKKKTHKEEIKQVSDTENER